jgi:hypothetical protein
LDGVEAAVLYNDYKQSSEWLTVIEQHPEANAMTKAVASFYRFWISYADDRPSSKQDFQRLLTSLNEYKRGLGPGAASTAAGDNWSFGGVRRVLAENKLDAAKGLTEDKKEVLLAIMNAFDHPEHSTRAEPFGG